MADATTTIIVTVRHPARDALSAREVSELVRSEIASRLYEVGKEMGWNFDVKRLAGG